MNELQESPNAAMSSNFRPRSDSLDIFTMSPLGSPSLDTLDSVQDSAPSHLRLPEPSSFDLNSGLPQRCHPGSPPSTPNSPTSFSFSPPVRASAVCGDAYAGTSYSTDLTSFMGSWSPGRGIDDDPAPPKHPDKGKGVDRAFQTEEERDEAERRSTYEGEGKGKGKGRAEDATPVELDIDSQTHGDVVDLSSDFGDVDSPPVVRLSSGARYHQFPASSAGPSSNPALEICSVAATSFKGESSPRASSPLSSPSPIPSSEGLSSEGRQRSSPHMPTHRRSLSSLSILSIRSSSTRSFASIRSAMSGAASVRGRVKSMAPAAKKLKGGLRKMFRRQNAGTGFEGDAPESCEGSGDERDLVRRHGEHLRGHIGEASTESQMTVSPGPPPGIKHVPETVPEEGRRVSSAKPRSKSAPTPSPTPHKKSHFLPSRVVATDVMRATPNRFNDLLPRELQLAVLRMLVAIYEVEHARGERDDDLSSTQWSARMAGRTRWVGRNQGLRELVKFSRVSKVWQALVFDGQLWGVLHLASYPPHLPRALLLRIAEHAGGFVRSLDLRGWSHLDTVTLRALIRLLARDIVPPRALAAQPFPATNLTHVALRSCTALTSHSLHHVLLRSPALRSVDFHGLSAVTNATCGVLGTNCPLLERADLRRCPNMDGEGLAALAEGRPRRSFGETEFVFPVDDDDAARENVATRQSNLRVLRASGVRYVDEEIMSALAKGAPNLEVLDLSGARDLTDDAVAAFVAWDENWDAEECGGDPPFAKVQLDARQMGRDPAVDHGPFYKRVTRLRHINLSGCQHLTDAACTHLAHCVPQLEFLELAGIGADLKDEGLVRLLGTTPRLRRLDLEDACDITDEVLEALDPAPALEHLVLSYALQVTNDALLSLIRRCSRLSVLECDNTRISPTVVREFVRLMRARNVHDAELVAVDCRSITEVLIKDLASAGVTRARRGFRHYDARALGYVDGRDKEFLGPIEVDECDAARVIVKSFWSWQAVDAVREFRRRFALAARRNADAAGGGGGEALYLLGLSEGMEGMEISGQDGAGPSIRPRWLGHWTRGGSTAGTGGPWSPAVAGFGNDEDRGCTIM